MTSTYENHDEFMEALRESGVTDMSSAHIYLMDEFDLSQDTAIAIVREWLKRRGEPR